MDFDNIDDVHDKVTDSHHGLLLNIKLLFGLTMEAFEKYNKKFNNNDLVMEAKINAKKNNTNDFLNSFINIEEEIIKDTAFLLQQQHESNLLCAYSENRLIEKIKMVKIFQEDLFTIFFNEND
jgi:hypothetical protein